MNNILLRSMIQSDTIRFRVGDYLKKFVQVATSEPEVSLDEVRALQLELVRLKGESTRPEGR